MVAAPAAEVGAIKAARVVVHALDAKLITAKCALDRYFDRNENAMFSLSQRCCRKFHNRPYQSRYM